MIFQRLRSLSYYSQPANTSYNHTTTMSNSSDSSSLDEYTVLTSTELSRLLLDQEMNFAVATAFSSSPLSTTLLRQYLFISQNLERLRQDLLRHQQEREAIFDILSHSAPFQDIMNPIVLSFRYRQRQVVPITPPSPSLRVESNAPISERQTVIIQERSDSDDSHLSYYTTAHEELGTRQHPIDVDRLFSSSPSPRTHSAPVTAPCSLCKRPGHSSTQCVWNGPGQCSYCDKIGHTIHSCTTYRRDRQRFDPHLLYCLTCGQSGHTAATCGTFLSRR